MQPIEWLHEYVPAAHSPFHADGSLAPEVVAAQAAFLAANDIRTVFITGSTGECHSLTCAERLALYDAWAAAGTAHGIAVIAHVGGNSIEDARALARRARELELSAISALAPSVLQARDPVGADRLVRRHCCRGAGPAVLLLRHSLAHRRAPADGALPGRGSRRGFASLAGIKFTNPDLVSVPPVPGCRRPALRSARGAWTRPCSRRSPPARAAGRVDLQLGAEAVCRPDATHSSAATWWRPADCSRCRLRWSTRSPARDSWAPARR